MSDEQRPERVGYTLVVGGENPDRDWIVASLHWGQMEVYGCNEDYLREVEDLQPPAMIVLDHHGQPAEVRTSLKAVLTHPALIGVPLLVLSYNADIDSFSTSIADGAAAYLVKPLDAEELVAVVKKLSGWTGVTSNTEKRRRLRGPLLLKVEVDLRAQKRRVQGQIVDASGGGCRVELSEAVTPGVLVRLVLQSHQGSTHVALGAEVRWHRQAPDGTHVAGLKFTGTTAVYAGQLLGFAAREQALL